MALPVVIPNTFAGATASIPLSQLDGNFSTLANAVNGISDGSETLANVTATTANITTVNATNLEVTNIKAKDGTAAGSIADSTGVVTLASSVLTTTDINGGSIDAVTLGTNSPVTEAQIDNININGNTIVSSDTDGDLNLTPNGAGDLVLDGLKWPQADGTADYVLKTNGSGQLSWTAQSGGGGGSPGGSDTQVQFNDGGSFGGDSGLTYNKTTDVLTVSGGAVLQGLTAGRGAGGLSDNTAFGTSALASVTTGNENVAIGYQALNAGTTVYGSVAVGRLSFTQNTTGRDNTGLGHLTGYNVTTGTKNLSVYAGANASSGYLAAGSSGAISIGTADGEQFGYTSSLGTKVNGMIAGKGSGQVSDNTAFGFNALSSVTTGNDNTAVGFQALNAITSATGNTALGRYTCGQATTGINNTGLGHLACYNVTTGTKNLSVYAGANATGYLSAGSSGLISIGTVDGERLRIETNAFKAALVYSETTGSAANVFVASDGKMSRSTSSQRYKKNIQDAVHGLEKVLQMRPVTFNHINPDEAGIVYGGLIAEEVHDLGLTEFVEYTWDGKPDSLRYGHMVSLLVKAVQELNARVVALEAQGA